MPVSLHTHSWYSLLEGASSLEALVHRAVSCGQQALALTDTNNLYGAVAFSELAQAYGLRPFLGACLRQHRSRCVALIAEKAGYRSLCRVLSRLHLGRGEDERGEGRGARGEKEDPSSSPLAPSSSLAPRPWPLAPLLSENADGLHVLVDDVVMAERLREAFEPRLWLEVVRPARSARQEQELLAGGRRLGLRPVASTAAHFATADDYPSFRVVQAVRQGLLLDQLSSRFSITPEHHLVDSATLRQRFRDLPEAVRNTDLLAEQLRADVLPRDLILPQPRLPGRLEAGHYLRLLCERGLRRRDLGDSLGARQRLREELTVIEAGNLAGYFLVVRDIARHARRKRHSMALRGSAGNSLVCYLLEITDVDPLRFHLPMERFLHPGRVDLPDIDLDFDWKVRDEVLAHVFRRFGPEHTAMISTHQFLQPRSAFREAAKAHGLSNVQVSRLLETLPERLEAEIAESGERRVARKAPAGFPLEAERWPRLLVDARRLLGRPHHLSIHPGGVVITPRPIEEYVPVQRAAKGIVITQFEKDAAEHIGLVKIDLLGNRALGTVDEAMSYCRSRVSEKEVNAKPQAAQTVALLQRGDTLGVNQLESPAMRHLLVQMRPRGLEDVIRVLALIRPGAGAEGMKECFVRRRRGLEPIPQVYPPLDELLAENEGVLLYEDDALRVIQLLTGLPVPDADRFRKRVSKHRTAEEAVTLAAEFRRLCAAQSVPDGVAVALWPHLARFSHYTFCKSHAVSYGLIAWTAAHLKVHQPLAFWTAALNNNQGMYPRWVYIEAVKRAGIALRLPCVNRSRGPFTLEEGAIRTGLDAVATLDEGLWAALLEERQRHGLFRDLADFRHRVQPGPDALAVLIRCGALDFTGRSRPALFLEADLQGAANEPIDCLLPSASCLPDDWEPVDYPAERRWGDEWRLLGFTVGPPLVALFQSRLPADRVLSRDLAGLVGRRVKVAGLVAAARQTTTTDGRPMHFITLEDGAGLIDLTFFPGAPLPAAYLSLGPYVATGVVEQQYDVITVTAEGMERILLGDS